MEFQCASGRLCKTGGGGRAQFKSLVFLITVLLCQRPLRCSEAKGNETIIMCGGCDSLDINDAH